MSKQVVSTLTKASFVLVCLCGTLLAQQALTHKALGFGADIGGVAHNFEARQMGNRYSQNWQVHRLPEKHQLQLEWVAGQMPTVARFVLTLTVSDSALAAAGGWNAFWKQAKGQCFTITGSLHRNPSPCVAAQLDWHQMEQNMHLEHQSTSFAELDQQREAVFEVFRVKPIRIQGLNYFWVEAGFQAQFNKQPNQASDEPSQWLNNGFLRGAIPANIE